MPSTYIVKVRVAACSRSLTEVAGSNPAGCMDVCVVLCVLYSKDKRQKAGTVMEVCLL